MAKKWIAVLLVICIGLGVEVVYMREQSDRQAPEIICTDEAAAEYNPGMSDAQLLKGIKAIDDKDGDVSDSLTVESIYEVDNSNVVVTYVAKDTANNITKLKRNMVTDPQKTEENSRGNNDVQDDTEVTPVPVEDVEEDEGTSEESQNSPIDETVTSIPKTDDVASQAAAEQEKMADAMPAQSPRIYLSEYYVTASVGSSIDLLAYVKDIQDDKDNVSELWRRIQIDGQVNTATAGTYICTYYVIDSEGNMSNTAELTIVVG